MLLRDLLLKSRHGVPNWHPLGNRLGKIENTRLQGEVAFSAGSSSRVQCDAGLFVNSCEDSSDTGCLSFDYALCQQAAKPFNFAAIVPSLAKSFSLVIPLLKKKKKQRRK